MEKEVIVHESFEKNSSMGCSVILLILIVLGIIVWCIYSAIDDFKKFSEFYKSSLELSIFFSISLIILLFIFVPKIPRYFRSAYNPKEVLIINDEGITDKNLYGLISWDNIIELSLVRDPEARGRRISGKPIANLVGSILIEAMNVQMIVISLKRNDEVIRNLPLKKQANAIGKCREGEPFVEIRDSDLALSSWEIYEIMKKRLDWYKDQQNN